MDVSTLGHSIIGFSSSVRRSIVVHRSSICFIPSLINGRANYSFFKPLMWVEVGHLLIYPLYGCSTSSDLLPVLFTFPCVFLTWWGDTSTGFSLLFHISAMSSFRLKWFQIPEVRFRLPELIFPTILKFQEVYPGRSLYFQKRGLSLKTLYPNARTRGEDFLSKGVQLYI